MICFEVPSGAPKCVKTPSLHNDTYSKRVFEFYYYERYCIPTTNAKKTLNKYNVCVFSISRTPWPQK